MMAATMPWSPRRLALDLGAVAILLGVAIVGFWPTFGGGSYLIAAIGGMVLGLAIATFGAWRRWGILLVTGATIAAYFVFGGALALGHTTILGVVPTLDTFAKLALGTVTSWKQLLTTVTPVAAADGHLIVPFLLSLVTAVLAASLALRVRQVAVALIPIIAMLVLVIALGTAQPALPIWQGIIFGVISIAWLAVRQLWAPQNAAVSVGQADPTRAAHMRMRRLLAGAAVLAVAAGAGVATSALAAPTESRHIFRDVIIPPFNVRDYASPLQSFRKYVRDDAARELFSVRGLPEDVRIRIAAMDQFDGMVYNVTDAGPDSSSAFTPLRSNMAPDVAGIPISMQVTIGSYNNVWIPLAGEVAEIQFTGERADELRRRTHVNTGTGTAVVTSKLTAGDTFTVDAILPAQLTDEQLADKAFGKVPMPKQRNVPQELTTLASETVAGAATPIEQVRALESFLAEDGFFSHGLKGQVLSRAGHTTERISSLIGEKQMIGDDEQYAVAMALLAREIGIPARVVLGFYPDEENAGEALFSATGETIHAWVEVNFAGVGWVPFNPTPPEDQIPNDQSTKPKADPKPQVLQPPPPPQEPVDLPPTLPDDRESEDETVNIAGIIGLILLIGGGLLALIALFAAPFIIIGTWKATRRRARRASERTADRISGGWDELTDRAIDYGARFDPGATRAEEAITVSETFAVPAATALAQRADSEVFGPAEPTQDDVDAFWDDVEEIVGGLGEKATFFTRMKARLSVRSLMLGSKFSRHLQALKDTPVARIRREPGTIKSSIPPVSESETP